MWSAHPARCCCCCCCCCTDTSEHWPKAGMQSTPCKHPVLCVCIHLWLHTGSCVCIPAAMCLVVTPSVAPCPYCHCLMQLTVFLSRILHCDYLRIVACLMVMHHTSLLDAHHMFHASQEAVLVCRLQPQPCCSSITSKDSAASAHAAAQSAGSWCSSRKLLTICHRNRCLHQVALNVIYVYPTL